MQWDHLTSNEFARAVQQTGVCLLPTGVLEPHSDHMPLGTDCLISHRIACLAAEKEKAVVFPSFYFGQIYEARHFSGTVTLPPKLLLDLFLSTLDEIGRNGFRKIIIVNGHGGNESLLPFLTQACLAEDKSYQVYLPRFAHISEERRKKSKWGELMNRLDHAGEWEASLLLATHPDLVHLDRAPAKGGKALGRLQHLPSTRSAMGWYADHPEHYTGDARKASLKKGIAIRDGLVATLADYIAAVKADRVMHALAKEFAGRAKNVSGPRLPIEYVEDRKVDAALDAELRALLSSCFTGEANEVFRHQRFFNEMPAHRWLIRDDEGRLVAHLAVHDKSIGISSGRLRVGGIAEVCVAATHRGQGLVRQLLTLAHEWMASQGIGYSTLFGDSRVYSSSGYRNVKNPVRYLDPKTGKRQTQPLDNFLVKALTAAPWPKGAVDLRGPKF